MAKDNSAIAWYGGLKTGDKRTFWACFGGWTLDSLNFFIFTFAFPAIIAAFEITRREAGLLTTLPLHSPTVLVACASFRSPFYGLLSSHSSARFRRIIGSFWFAER